MKKIFTLLLCLPAVIILTACGGRGGNKKADSGKINADSVADKALEEAAAMNSFSQAAAEVFIRKHGGLDPKSIEPDWKYVVDEKTMANYGDRNHGSLQYQKTGDDSLTREVYEEWVRKVYAATKAISDDRINIMGFEDAKDEVGALTEKNLDEMFEKSQKAWLYLGMYTWGYRLNGKFMRVSTQYEENKNAAEIDIAHGMNKPWSELKKDMEKALDALK